MSLERVGSRETLRQFQRGKMEETPVAKQYERQVSLEDATSKPETPTQRRGLTLYLGPTTESDNMHSLDASGRSRAMDPPPKVLCAGGASNVSSSSEECLLPQLSRTDSDGQAAGASRSVTLAGESHASTEYPPLPPSYYTYTNSRVSIGLTSNETSATDPQEHRRPAADPPKREGSKRKRKRRSSSMQGGKQCARWNDMFYRLVEFKRVHGHCLVPNRYTHDPSLGAWVSTQRRHYKILMSGEEIETTPMTPDRIARLSSIGFAWATADPRHVPWETRFNELLEYKMRFGDCVVPIGFPPNPSLSNWVSAQRQEYKLFVEGKKCRITSERVRALDEIGFVWVAQRGARERSHRRKSMNQPETDGIREESPLPEVGFDNQDSVPNGSPPFADLICDRPPLGRGQERQVPPIRLPVPRLGPFFPPSDMANQLEREPGVDLQTGSRPAASLRPVIASDFDNTPSNGIVHPPPSIKSTSSYVGGPSFSNVHSNDYYLTTRATGSSRSTIPYNRNIVAHHIAQSLLQNNDFCGVEPAFIDAAVQRIEGIIERPNAQHSTFSVHSRREDTSRMPSRPQFRLESQPNLQRDRKELVSGACNSRTPSHVVDIRKKPAKKRPVMEDGPNMIISGHERRVHTGEVPAPPQILLDSHRNAQNDKRELVAAASKFGVALQVDEGAKKPVNKKYPKVEVEGSKPQTALPTHSARLGVVVEKERLGSACVRVASLRSSGPGLREAHVVGRGLRFGKPSTTRGDDVLGSAVWPPKNQDNEGSKQLSGPSPNFSYRKNWNEIDEESVFCDADEG